jgi:hypothetical protein
MGASKDLQAAVLAHPRARHAAKWRQVCGDISALNILYNYNGNIKFIEFNNDVHLYYNDKGMFVAKNGRINTIIDHQSIDTIKISILRRHASSHTPIEPCKLIPVWIYKYPNIRIVPYNNKQILMFDVM